ncbi:MAG: hypothetical protein M0017_06515 [Desulfobacteraceae bacterium]|nr:hypothetical protein [Desulfobacteraceae bacterium]
MKILVPAALLLCLALAGRAAAGDPRSAAEAAADAAAGRFGSAGAFAENGAAPLTSPGKELFTIDRSASGSVQIASPSSRAFLSLVVQPAATGDLGTVRIDQDLDFDGTPESGYVVPAPVSGVCANGVISCDPGTWLHCTPYAWTADGSGRVSLKASLLSDLGGCYCINQSCGSRLVWDNLGLVVKDLGGGAVGAVQAKKESWVITEVKADGPAISYYGRDTSDPAAGTGSPSQTGYFADAGAMAGDAQTEAAAQSGDPDSYAGLLAGSLAGRGTSTAERQCTDRRQISLIDWCSGPITAGASQASGACGADGAQSPTVVFDWQVTYRLADQSTHTTSGSVTRTLCVDHLMFTRIRQDPSGQTLDIQYEGTDPSGTQVGWNCGGVYTDWLTVDTVTLPADVREWEGRVNISYSGGGCEAGTAAATAYWCDRNCDVAESEDDTCGPLAADPDCRLETEKVDGVTTIRNFNPTGLAPLPSTRTFTSTGCSYDLTRNWWERDRTYRCTANSTFSFDDLAQRTGAIAVSVDANVPDAATVSYTDRRLGTDGAWTTDNHSLSLPDTDAGPGCEQVCKTRRPAEDTQAGQAGPTTDFRTGNAGYDFFYRTCDRSGNCPAGPGEEILTSCRCIDEFAEAASIMMSLGAAAKDIICSDGVKK